MVPLCDGAVEKVDVLVWPSAQLVAFERPSSASRHRSRVVIGTYQSLGCGKGAACRWPDRTAVAKYPRFWARQGCRARLQLNRAPRGKRRESLLQIAALARRRPTGPKPAEQQPATRAHYSKRVTSGRSRTADGGSSLFLGQITRRYGDFNTAAQGLGQVLQW